MSLAQANDYVFIGDKGGESSAYSNPVPAVRYKITSPTISTPNPTVKPLSSSQESGLVTSAAQAASDPNAAEVGLSNKGEVPQEGTPEEISPTPSNVQGDTIFARLAHVIDSALGQAAKGEWKENGSNPNILACYKAAGSNLSRDSTPWCAAFATNALKLVGAPAKATLSSLAYRGHGTPVDLNDKTKWRLNDIVVFTRDGGGHIGFFRGYNPNNGSILIAGGNQSDNLTEKGFRAGGMPVAYVGRAWDVPAEYDKPVTYNGTGGSVKVV